MSLSVIIPSKTASNLIPCVEAIRKHEPLADIIIIDDGLDVQAEGMEFIFFELSPPPALRVWGKKPFIFARNCNLGIAAGGRQGDVILCNDDCLLKTPGGFTALQKAAQEHPEYGIIAATCNNVGNENQWPKNIGLREDPRMVCFVAVLIPRRTIDLVGLLDERFVGYGMDDDDFSLRVRQAGLKIGIFDGCYVDHGSLTSSYRGAAGAGGDFRPNLKRYIEKWGVDNRGCGKDVSPFRELFP